MHLQHSYHHFHIIQSTSFTKYDWTCGSPWKSFELPTNWKGTLVFFFFSYFSKSFKLTCTLLVDLGVYPIEVITTLLHSTIVEIQIVEPKLQQIFPLPCLLDSYHIVFCPCRNILWAMLHWFIAYWLHLMLLIACHKRSPIFNKICFKPWHNGSFDA